MATKVIKTEKEIKREISLAATRVVQEVWKEKIQRDGTDMVMVPKLLFDRLEKAVKELWGNDEG